METLIFEYDNKCGHYHLKKYSNQGMFHLAFFLTDDVGCDGVGSFKEWINDPTQIATSSNYSYLEKDEDDPSKTIIGCEVEEGEPGEVVFETTIKQLNYILDRWGQLCKEKPKEIIITRDGDNVTLEGRN